MATIVNIGAFGIDDLAKDRLALPSLPEVAVGVCRALEDETLDAEQLAEVIQADVLITAKLFKAACNARHGDPTSVSSCRAAVARLGARTTRKLVLSFTLHELCI